MKQSIFKELYSKYRKVKREFEEHMQYAQYPCGHDDMLYENFAHHQNKWLDENPIIKQVITADLDGDHLEDRMNNYHACLKSAIKYRMA